MRAFFQWKRLRPDAAAAAGMLLALGPFSCLLQADDEDDRRAILDRVILSPRETADDFGKRIAQSHLAMQVTVINNSKQLDLVVRHAGIDLTKAVSQERAQEFVKRVEDANKRLGLKGDNRYNLDRIKMSSVDLALLQGVAQKGQHYDPRNRTYRLILAVGTVGAGLVGVAGLGPVLPRAVAAWTGPWLTAFSTLFPDLTVDELIRLNDRAYTANTLVPRGKSRVFVVFTPLDVIMTPKEKARYWKHPSDFISIVGKAAVASTSTPAGAGQMDLSQLEVEIDYDFIVPLTDIPPMVTDVVFADNELDNFTKKAPVHGSIVGRFLDGATVSLPDGTALGLDIALDTGATTFKSGENRLYFVITPQKVVPAGTRLIFQVTGNKQVTTFSKLLTHSVPPVTLTSLDPAKGSAKTDVAVKLGGSGFLKGDVTVLIDGTSDAGSGIKVASLSVKDQSHLEATFSIDEKAKPGVRQVQIKTSGGLSGVQNFTVEKAADAP
jgi:hypothetical protein